MVSPDNLWVGVHGEDEAIGQPWQLEHAFGVSPCRVVAEEGTQLL